MCDGNLAALAVHEANIDKEEQRLEYACEDIENQMGNDIDDLLQELEDMIKDHGLEDSITPLQYLKEYR